MESKTSPRQVRMQYCSIFSPGMELRAETTKDAEALKSQGLSLLGYLQDITLYESIFDNTISGHITLLENVGLVELLPVVGVEVVHIGFSVLDDHGEEQKFARGFRVARVRDVSYPRHGFRMYTLDLVTNEFVVSLSSRISRPFEGKSCADAVRTIMTQDLGINTDKTFVAIEPTFGVMNAVIPNYTPLQAINYFTMLAQTVKAPHESNFLFFETLDGFFFQSVSSMITLGKVGTDLRDAKIVGPSRPHEVKTFRFDPGAITGGPVEDKIVRNALLRMHQEQTFNLLEDITGGLFRSKMVHFDFLARKLAVEEDSRYTETFKKTTHLDKHPFYPNNFDLAVSKNTRIFTFPSNAWASKSQYLKSIEPQPDQNMWQAIVLRNRQLREIQHLQTLIDTPGHPELRAGKVIDVQYLPTHALQGSGDKSASSSGRGDPTPYYSGHHLITSLKHSLKLRGGMHFEYRMHMRVCRDSLSAPLIGTSSTQGL